MRMGWEGPKDEAGTQQRGGGLPRSESGNKVTGPGWWAKLIEHYGEKQKNLAVNFAAEVDEITNAGHHKIVSDLLDKGEWQKAAKAALVAYYCKDTSTEVFKKVLEAPLAGEAAFICSQSNQGHFNVGSEALRDVVAHAVEDSQRTPQQQLYAKYHSDLTQLQVRDSLWIMDNKTLEDLVRRNVPTDRRIPLPDEAALQSFPANCVLLLC